MHDVQVLGQRGGDLPEGLLASIAQIAGTDTPRWVGWTSLGLAATAILLATARTVPSAMRLGRRTDTLGEQSRLARSISRDHVCCLAAIAVLLTIELTFGGS